MLYTSIKRGYKFFQCGAKSLIRKWLGRFLKSRVTEGDCSEVTSLEASSVPESVLRLQIELKQPLLNIAVERGVNQWLAELQGVEQDRHISQGSMYFDATSWPSTSKEQLEQLMHMPPLNRKPI